MAEIQAEIHHSPLQKGLSLALSAGLTASLLAAGLPGLAQDSGSDPVPDVEPASEGSPLPEDARFECQLYEGDFTVMYRPQSQPDQVYPWATPGEMGGGWTAERRCWTISERLESYRPEGLVELQVGIENGYDIVCATTEQVPGLCKIVFTVPPGQNPVITRDRVFENLALADAGSDTTVVNTYTSDATGLWGQISEAIGLALPGSGSAAPTTSDGINLKPFLDAADGGTGEALTP